MATDFSLTTTQIDSLVSAYTQTQNQILLDPYTAKQSKYQDMISSYDSIFSNLTSFQSLLSGLKGTGSDSVFINKSVSSSDSSVSATADNTAIAGSYELLTSQLAKSDNLVSGIFANTGTNTLDGTHNFVIRTGDGTNEDFTSNIQVTFKAGETNQSAMQKIRDSINGDKAVIQSDTKSASDSYSGGPATFNLNLNGTNYVISAKGGGTYGDLMDEVVKNIKANVSGVTAEKVTDTATGNVSLKLTVNDNSNYISISKDSGNDIVSDLGIAATKEKSAAGLLTASTIASDSSDTQFTLSSKNSGLDYRIKSMDDAGGDALKTFGLNLGSSRPEFNQATIPVKGGYVNADITSELNKLNSKFVFNGINVQRSSNTISDLITGVSFNLKSVTATGNPPAVLSVSLDNSATTTKINSFISGFNSLYKLLKTDSAYGTGTLHSDTNVSSIISILSSSAISAMPGSNQSLINTLNKIGITFNSSTGLSISDNTLLQSSLTSNSTEVESLFNSSDGIANTLYNKLNPYLGAAGYLKNSEKSFTTNLTYINDRITSNTASIAKSSDDVRSRYETLQAEIASILTSQAYFASLFTTTS
jgi:flagellar hook-associated protein 2